LEDAGLGFDKIWFVKGTSLMTAAIGFAREILKRERDGYFLCQ